MKPISNDTVQVQRNEDLVLNEEKGLALELRKGQVISIPHQWARALIKDGCARYVKSVSEKQVEIPRMIRNKRIKGRRR